MKKNDLQISFELDFALSEANITHKGIAKKPKISNDEKNCIVVNGFKKNDETSKIQFDLETHFVESNIKEKEINKEPKVYSHEKDLNKIVLNDLKKNDNEKVLKNKTLENKVKLTKIEDLSDFSSDDLATNSKSLYQKDVKSIDYRLLTKEEENNFFKKIRSGDTKAREEFIKLNLKLVISIANKYTGYTSTFSDLDIIQEGNIGLMIAIKKYEPSRGNKFSTYAVHWIHQSIKRALEEKTKTIKLPSCRVQQINKINKFKSKFIVENNVEPTEKEIAIGIDSSESSVKKALSYNSNIMSLNTTYTEDNDVEFAEVISDGFNLEDEVIRSEELKGLAKCFELLNKEEREIITLKFFNNYKISQIERALDIPRTQVNNILESSLKKMRKFLTKYQVS